MKSIKMPCKVVEGVVKINRASLDLQSKTLKDGLYTLTIEPVPNTISHRQRKYFFGVVVEDLQKGFSEQGNAQTQEQIRDILDDLFFYRETYNSVLDRYIRSRISLSNSPKGITKEEFNRIKDAIQTHAITVWGIYVHDPNEPIFKE